MISKIIEENQVKRLFENMPLTTPEITEDDNIVYSGDWTQDTTDTDDLPNYCTPHDEYILQSVKNEVEDDEHIDVIKEEDAWCNLEYGLGRCGNEKDELPTQKVDSVKSEGEVDDQLDIIKEEDEWCKELKFDCLGHLNNKIDETAIHKVECAGDSGTQYTVRPDTEISQDHEVGSLLTNPVKQSNKRKIKRKVPPNQNNLNGYQFNRKYNLNRCAKKQTRNGNLTCKLCNKQYMYESGLEKHMLTHTSKKIFPCSLCNKQFSNKSNYNRHMYIHSDKKPYKCELCNNKYIRKSFLKTHMWTHSSEKPYKCTFCDKEFIWKTNYSRHMLRHTSKSPFECTLCDKQFKDKFIYNKHMFAHSEKKPFKCELCDKKYKRQAFLTEHMWIHSSVKRYKCRLCHMEYTWRINYTRHMLKHSAAQSTVSCDTDIPQDHNDCSLSTYPINQSNAFEIIYNDVKYTI